jgi:Family of unknown function (DUF6350)
VATACNTRLSGLSCHDRGVTDVLDRTRAAATRTVPARGEPAAVASVWLRGAVAAVTAATVGLASLIVISLIVWAADSRSEANAGDAMRVAAEVWLVAHRTPLRMPGGAWTLPPLGLTLLLGWLLARAASVVARGSHPTEVRDLGVVVAAVTLPYAAIAGVVAAVTATPSVRPPVGAAVVCAAVVGGSFAAVGAARGSGLTTAAWRSVRYDIRTALSAAAAAGAVLLGAAALLTVATFIAHEHRVGSILAGYGGGPGKFSMVLLSVLLVPNAVVFGLAYLVGPGFAVGTGTSVAFGGVHLAAVPRLPLLAALPGDRAPLPIVVAGCLVLVVAGVVAGRRIARRATGGVHGQLICVLMASAAMGAGSAILVGLAGGPAGPGRLSAVGASPWQVGLVLAAQLALVAAVTVVLWAWLRRRQERVSGS